MYMMLVKIGGSVVENLWNILHDLPEENLIIVHGGAREVTRIAEMMKIKQRFVVSQSGYRSRYTDEKTIEIFQMVIAGKINKDIVRMLGGFGRRAVGVCGLDDEMIRARRKRKLMIMENNRKMLIDGGYTGKIISIKKDFIEMLLKKNIIPVIASLAAGEEHEPLNINGDALAIKMATVFSCDPIIFLTNTDGVLDEDNRTVERINLSELGMLKVGLGMKRKLFEITNTTAKKIVIANGLVKKPFSDMRGTVIENDRE